MSDGAQGVGHGLIQRGCSMQNDQIDRFNGKLQGKYHHIFFAHSPANVLRLRSGVMARVILGKQIGAGRGDFRVAKVVANWLGSTWLLDGFPPCEGSNESMPVRSVQQPLLNRYSDNCS